ncbi:isochorismate synthase [Aeromonas schubertii]|uniref:isochorismate synthase n=1 Tax=Aeromonas schubertii TaxID=652 RepID=UPI00067F37EE|nr:isochorismate synthase [Aeromonas schubertii]KUE80929.1 isochorismate synthase [Aeromonas schubertii]
MLAPTHLMQQLDALRHEATCGFVRLRVPARVDSFLGWLSSQPLYPRIYWHARGDDRPEYATLGCIREIRDPARLDALCHQTSLSGADSPRYFGGLAFDPDGEGWPGFGPCRLILPRIELVRRGEEVSLCLNLLLDEGEREQEIARAKQALQALCPEHPLTPMQGQGYLRHDTPDFATWHNLVERVTAPDFQAHTPKVVLSRASRLETAHAVDPWQMLESWRARAQGCFHFGFQFEKEQAFISCSPERLYRREGHHLFTEALAGTIRRSGDEAIDAALAHELLSDNKNRLENRLVHADILSRLAPLAQQTSLTEPRILKLRLLQHLKCDIEAELHPGVEDWQLLAALHPTPAVGGAPREAAIDFIRRHEPYRRGWYAGACGMLSRDTSEFSVAIRSALLDANAVTLFAGAGIVAGSEPSAEWAELDNKIDNVLSLLAQD